MYKKAYNILKNNIIFIQPLLLWQLVFSAVLVFSMNRMQLVIPRIIMWVSLFLLFTACLTGWLHINRLAVLSYNEKDSQDEIIEKNINNFKKFFEGIGIDFFRIILSLFVIICLYSGILYAVYKFCIIKYGISDFFEEIFNTIQNGTKEQIVSFLNTIDKTNKLIFAKWVLTVNTVISILNFFTILYLAVLSFEKNNFIFSLFKAVKFFLLNIFESIGIMIFVFIIYFLINILSLLFASNFLIFTLLIIIITMYFNYYVLLVFCFYNDKIKNNSNNGS